MKGLSVPRGITEWFEFLGLTAVIVGLTTGPVYFFSQRVLHIDGTWETRPIKVGFALCALVGSLVWLSMALRRKLKRPDIPLAVGGIYVAFAVASTTWSILPRQTLWRSLIYVGMWLLAWALASLDFDRLWTVLSASFGFATLSSLLIAIARPEMGIATDSGNWRGIYTSPNSLGPVCALFILTMLGIIIMNDNLTLRVGAAAAAAAGSIPLWKSSAETAVLALGISVIASIAVTGVARLSRSDRSGNSWVAPVVASAVGLGATAIALPVLAATSGIQLRWEVWQVVWERIMLKPWFGYGFFTYWGTGASMQPRTIALAGSSHNSVLEAGLDLGIIGMVVFVSILVLAVLYPARRLWTRTSVVTALMLSVAVFVTLSHMTESFVSWFSYMFVLLIVAASHDPGPALGSHETDRGSAGSGDGTDDTQVMVPG